MGWEWILIFSIFIVAIYLFWMAAKRISLNSTDRVVRNIPPEYLRGLNYVLNEQQDKAIELFIKMLEVDSDTVETHLALGNLFRRRGEVDRAIRIHQNLIARPTLSEEERYLALLELGMDYMKSGLLDRAESLFTELVETGNYRIQAYNELLDIYQQEKDWNKAITIAKRLQMITGENLSPVIAQFHCELAEKYMNEGKSKEVVDCIRHALNIDPGCVRASILEARKFIADDKVKLALKSLKRIEKQDPEYLPEVINFIIDCYRKLGKQEECINYLHELNRKYDGITTLLYLTQIIQDTQGEKDAIHFIADELRKRPTVRGVDKLLEYVLAMADGEIRENLKTIKDMTASLLDNSPIYKCIQCGFDAKLLHWYCPSCKQWSSIKPVHGVAGE